MYIPMGRRVAHRAIGRVADFCPLCRAFRASRLVQLESVRHFYYVHLGGHVAVGFARICETCGLEVNADPTTYTATSRDPDAGLERLIAETNPDIRRKWASRMILEDRIRSRKLTSGERAGLLREPFEMADDVLARRSSGGRLDGPSNLGCLATFLLPAACLVILPIAAKLPGETLEWITVGVGATCLAFTVVALLTDAGRHARREVLPRLVAAIRPLDPTAEEIDEIHESFRRARAPIAEVVRPREVANALIERWE